MTRVWHIHFELGSGEGDGGGQLSGVEVVERPDIVTRVTGKGNRTRAAAATSAAAPARVGVVVAAVVEAVVH